MIPWGRLNALSDISFFPFDLSSLLCKAERGRHAEYAFRSDPGYRPVDISECVPSDRARAAGQDGQAGEREEQSSLDAKRHPAGAPVSRGGQPGPKLTADALKKRYARGVPNPYANILDEADSLLLTEEQQKAVDSAQKEYLLGIDSIWTDLANYLAALPDKFNAQEAVRRQEKANDDAWLMRRQQEEER